MGSGAHEARDAGGKGANLSRLVKLGHAVPPFVVVSAAALDETLHASGARREVQKILDRLGPNRIGEEARAIQEIVSKAPFPAPLRNEILAAVREIIAPEEFAAVRSSALDEDAAALSFAGLHDSFLFVRGDDAVIDAIRRVWASAFNERALAYRLNAGSSLHEISIAVVVQKMIDPRSSGVAFTVNPVNESVQQVLINALYGAGEGLVSRGFDTDSYVVDKQTMTIEATLAVKSEAVVMAEGGGVRAVAVETGRAELPSLSDDQAHSVAKASIEIEGSFGKPQDIEFAFDHAGKLYILQTRPITTAAEYGPAAGNPLLWDNSNIIESFSGVTSPMTFSVIRRAYTIVYRCFAEVMGIRPGVVQENRFVFENMLGLFRGQVYYNIRNWYRLVGMFPGFNYNRAFMESMMGVRQPSVVDAAPQPAMQRYLVELPALMKLLGRSGRNFFRIRSLTAEFETNFRENYSRWSKIDLDSLRPHELMNLYLEFEERVLWKWRAPIINDFFVMIFYGVLRKLTAKWCGDEGGSLQNDLISGEGGIESTEPAKQLLRMAAVAAADDTLREVIVTMEPADSLAMVQGEASFASFSGMIDHYLDLYGFRCMNELKLEEPSLRDNPAFLMMLLRNYLTGDASRLDLAVQDAREQEIRRDAERRAFGAIRSPIKRAVFRRVLANARLGVKNRENMRFARTRIFGLVREVMRAIGRQFTAEGLIATPQDIFLLTLDEVFDYIKGTAVTTDLAGLIELRRREFDAYRAGAPADDRFETFGMAYHRNAYAGPRDETPLEEGVLRGTPCSPGRITGSVKVLRSPDEARLSGEILVAERTDPGWVPLYPSISGLLIERGSILSHSAIVAREMGIPTIVGIRGLTGTLKSGDVVTMDGSAGSVHIEGDGAS